LQAIVIRAVLFSFDFDGIVFMRKIKMSWGCAVANGRFHRLKVLPKGLVATAAIRAKYVVELSAFFDRM
jgi:hypothetical protein